MIDYLFATMFNLLLGGKRQLAPSEYYAAIAMGVILTFGVYLLDKILPHSGCYVVYRHYGGRWPDIEERKHDHQLIVAAYQRSTSVQFHDERGMQPTMARPWFEFLMQAEDIPNWLEDINELLSSGKLKYYTDFGLDRKGLGLVEPRDLGVKK